MSNNNKISGTTRSKQPETTAVPRSLFCHPYDNARQIEIDKLMQNGPPPQPAKVTKNQGGDASLTSKPAVRKRKINWGSDEPAGKKITSNPQHIGQQVEGAGQVASTSEMPQQAPKVFELNEMGHPKIKVNTDFDFFKSTKREGKKKQQKTRR
ncbi:hypothetical protein BDV93DRAFT_612272 [Ceratobasidium sp. AG-I]|nr:hypothetical protein BDV93DRAFT_612272 [Ceratobasidium sp. AG-I]